MTTRIMVESIGPRAFEFDDLKSFPSGQQENRRSGNDELSKSLFLRIRHRYLEHQT